MANSTPLPSSPSERSIRFIQAFARLYRPEQGVTPSAASFLAALDPAGSC